LARALALPRPASERFAAAARFFPAGVLAPAVFRPVLRLAAETRFGPAPLRADARPPAPARLFDGVRFCPFVDFRAGPAVLRLAAFFAMVSDPSSAWNGRAPAGGRRAR
jgi:hypothetical protein